MLTRLITLAIAIISATPVAAGESVELGTRAEVLALLMQDDGVGSRPRIVPRFPIAAGYDRPTATRFAGRARSRPAVFERADPPRSLIVAMDDEQPWPLALIPGWPPSRPEAITSMFGPQFAVSDALVLPRPPRRTGLGASVQVRLDGDEDTPLFGLGRAIDAAGHRSEVGSLPY